MSDKKFKFVLFSLSPTRSKEESNDVGKAKEAQIKVLVVLKTQ